MVDCCAVLGVLIVVMLQQVAKMTWLLFSASIEVLSLLLVKDTVRGFRKLLLILRKLKFTHFGIEFMYFRVDPMPDSPLGASTPHQSLIYRVGSVAQDTQVALWDIEVDLSPAGSQTPK